MRRRVLLAAIGTVSAGCLGSAPRTGSPTSPRPVNSETPTESVRRRCPGEGEGSPTGPTAEAETDSEYRLTGLETSTTVDRPSVASVLEPSAFYSGDAVEREANRTGAEQVVWDITDVEDDAVRDAIETAIRTGDWRSNALPEGLADTVERVDFFTGVSRDDVYTHVGLTLYRFQPDQPPAVAFDARIVDDVVSTGSPGAIELALVNESETTQYVFAGTVPPFGTVYADFADGNEEFLLWREYSDEGCITVADDGVWSCSIGTVTDLGPCERLTRRYEVLPSDTARQPAYTVAPGPRTYSVAGSVNYREEHGAPGSGLSFEVTFALESL